MQIKFCKIWKSERNLFTFAADINFLNNLKTKNYVGLQD